MLDAGCGEGCNTRKLTALGARVNGVDIAVVIIERACAEEERHPRGIDYRVGSFPRMPFFPDGSFDLAVSFMALKNKRRNGVQVFPLGRYVVRYTRDKIAGSYAAKSKPGDGLALSDLADSALYHAKESGRNRVSVYKSGMTREQTAKNDEPAV